MRLIIPTLLIALVSPALCVEAAATQPQPRVLVFSKTAGFRHDSIPTAVAALQRLGAQEGLAVDHSEDAGDFNDKNLRRYRAVIFASTTGDVLDAAQQAAMENFVRAGGGYMGVHAAADTEYDWPWYGQLVGAWFKSHPPGLQTTKVVFEHAGIPTDAPAWTVTDEIYNYRSNPRSVVQVTATVDERDYQGGTMGADHPIAWCHSYDGGRAWYTGLGHEIKLYADPQFEAQLKRGLRYTVRLADEC
jgi:type 1 glutamine amidotransferase